MDIWLILLVFLVSLGSGIISGMSTGGGGFIVMPLLIFLGLPPASALATMKFGGLGTSLGSLTAFKGKGFVEKRYILILGTITLACALLSAWLIPQIEPELFKSLIGWTLLLTAPTLFIKKAAFQPGPRTKWWIIIGFVVYAIVSFGQTLLGTGIGSLVVLVLMYMFGMDALRASATKRVTQSVQSLVLAVLLAVQGFVVWTYAIMVFIGAAIGTHIGTEFAIKRGVKFVKYSLAALMVISGVLLLMF